MSRGGHTHGRARLPVESCHSLSAWGWFTHAQMWTNAEDDLEFSWDGDDKCAVIRFTRNGRACVQEIALETTPCHYGGVRFWFKCPACLRRVGKVYLPCTMYLDYSRAWRVEKFLCRHCWGLTYEQRRERAPYWSLIHRRERIEARWFGEIEAEWIYKPKGQHWATFNKKFDEWENLIERHERAAMVGFEKFARRLGLDYEGIKK